MKKKNLIRSALLIAGALSVGVTSCKEALPNVEKPDPSRSDANAITAFAVNVDDFPDCTGSAEAARYPANAEVTIDPEQSSIYVLVPLCVPKVFAPQITLSDGTATIAPLSDTKRSFADPVSYTVRAANGSKREWKVRVEWFDPVKIPTYANSFLHTNEYGFPDAAGASLSAADGIRWQAGAAGRISVFVVVRQAGDLRLALYGVSGGAALNAKVKINGEPLPDYDHTIPIPAQTSPSRHDLPVITLPAVPQGRVGHSVELDLGAADGTAMEDGYLFKFSDLWVYGSASVGTGGFGGKGLNYVPMTNQHFGRRGPSVHIRPDKPAVAEAGEMEYFYSEVYVPVGQDIQGSYFMCNGFDGGYGGIQVNGAQDRRVLFSVWNVIPENSNAALEAQFAPRLVRVNNQAAYRSLFTYGVFGNEGTGGQSRYNAMWQAGVTYKMLTRVRPHPDNVRFPNSTLFKAWFHNGVEWVFVAEWRRDEGSSTGVLAPPKWYSNAHHFLENFNVGTGHLSRYGAWGSDWYIGADGVFHECLNYTFTNDATGSNNERVDYAGGILPADHPLAAGAIFLKMGGYFTDNLPATAVRVFNKAGGNAAPVLDFDALNAMGTDDPAADMAVSGQSTSLLDVSEQYTE